MAAKCVHCFSGPYRTRRWAACSVEISQTGRVASLACRYPQCPNRPEAHSPLERRRHRATNRNSYCDAVRHRGGRRFRASEPRQTCGVASRVVRQCGPSVARWTRRARAQWRAHGGRVARAGRRNDHHPGLGATDRADLECPGSRNGSVTSAACRGDTWHREYDPVHGPDDGGLDQYGGAAPEAKAEPSDARPGGLVGRCRRSDRRGSVGRVTQMRIWRPVRPEYRERVLRRLPVCPGDLAQAGLCRLAERCSAGRAGRSGPKVAGKARLGPVASLFAFARSSVGLNAYCGRSVPLNSLSVVYGAFIRSPIRHR